MNPVNVADYLALEAAADPRRVALVHGRDATVTAAELHAATDRFAHGFRGLGIAVGDRVAVMIPPGLDFVSAAFALLKCGAVPVLIDPGMGVRGLSTCLATADVKAFVGVPKAHLARKLFGWAKSAAVAVNAGKRRLFCDAATGRFPDRGEFATPPVTADTPAAILFTSGSTGPAKGALYTHGMFAAQVETLRTVYGFARGEVDFCTFPLFALFAPALGLTSLVPRMDATRPGRADIAALVAQANRWGATNFFGSPAVMRNWAARPELRVPTLKRAISAGAPATAETVRKISAILPPGAELFTPYGMTEALPVANIGGRELVESHALTGQGAGVCVGRPVPGVTVRVVAQTPARIEAWDESARLPAGEIGEFCVKAAVVSPAYFARHDATMTAKIPDDGGGFWHRTGDVGYFDSAGRMWFCGRKAHVVWTPGGPLYPDQVEPLLNRPNLRTALVGVTRGGVTTPVICYETRDRLGPGVLSGKLGEVAAKSPLTAGIRTFLCHPGFPVDVRHNSKIRREELAAWAAKKLGEQVNVLVTGGGGFLGGAVARRLLARGDRVTSLTRTAYPWLDDLGIKQVHADLADADAVSRATAGADAVIHVAAKAGVWGPYAEYHAANVTGTESVIRACRERGVGKLVYTSTPSVVHGGDAHETADESAPYPRRHEAAYPATKAAAERLVLAANDGQLATVALRPHLVWGPLDTNLIPRVVARARAGKLRRVGAKPVTVDVTYVDNAADAHINALDRLAPGAACSGKAYFITNGEPVELWEFLNRVLRIAGVPPVTKSVPVWRARLAANVLERVYRTLRLRGEPPLTRFVVSQLSTSHYFDVTAARRDLGYEPRVTIDEGLARLAASLAPAEGARRAA